MSHDVETSAFSGPFDLLLHLILSEKVDLWEISISGIIDSYLVQVARMETNDLETMTEFLLIAATLVDIKARRLLPGADDGEIDEDLLRFEERDLLLARLLDAKTFKDAAQSIDAMRRRASLSFTRNAGPEEPFASLAPDPLAGVKLARIFAAAQRALAPKSIHQFSLEHLAPVRASVRDAIEVVLALMPSSGVATFKTLTSHVEHRLEIIVRFLALLELYKQGVIDIDQGAQFGDLVVRFRPVSDRGRIELGELDDWGDDYSQPVKGTVSEGNIHEGLVPGSLVPGDIGYDDRDESIAALVPAGESGAER